MKILFDQGTPVPLRKLLPDHSIITAYERGWQTLETVTLSPLLNPMGLRR